MKTIVAQPYKARQLLPTTTIPDMTFLRPKFVFTIGTNADLFHLTRRKLLLALITNLIHLFPFVFTPDVKCSVTASLFNSLKQHQLLHSTKNESLQSSPGHFLRIGPWQVIVL